VLGIVTVQLGAAKLREFFEGCYRIESEPVKPESSELPQLSVDILPVLVEPLRYIVVALRSDSRN
jgi:hypothetical protein